MAQAKELMMLQIFSYSNQNLPNNFRIDMGGATVDAQCPSASNGEFNYFFARSTVSGAYHASIARVKPDGTIAWSGQYGHSSHRIQVMDAVVDTDGNLYVACSSSFMNQTESATITKISPNGVLLWNKSLNNSDNSKGMILYGIAINIPNGTLMAVGATTKVDGKQSPICFSIAAATGNISWYQYLHTNSSTSSYLFKVVSLTSGQFFAIGRTQVGSGGYDVSSVVLNTNGTISNEVRLQAPSTTDNLTITGVSRTAFNEIFAVGKQAYWDGTNSNTRTSLIKFAGNGSYSGWYRSPTTTVNVGNSNGGMYIDSANNIWLNVESNISQDQSTIWKLNSSFTKLLGREFKNSNSPTRHWPRSISLEDGQPLIITVGANSNIGGGMYMFADKTLPIGVVGSGVEFLNSTATMTSYTPTTLSGVFTSSGFSYSYGTPSTTLTLVSQPVTSNRL
jgi:hypothetical protein